MPMHLCISLSKQVTTHLKDHSALRQFKHLVCEMLLVLVNVVFNISHSRAYSIILASKEELYIGASIWLR
jgi:hypothetical protein